MPTKKYSSDYDASVRLRMPIRLKDEAAAVFRSHGLTPSQAVRLIYREIIRTGRLPKLEPDEVVDLKEPLLVATNDNTL
jgi:addiction module RelB/DinJ family antitoxin